MALEVFDLLLEDDQFECFADSTIDPAFRKIRSNYSDFIIWRIVNGIVTSVPRERYGTFFSEEAYIIYAAGIYGQSSGLQAVSKEVRGIEYHIHFWLGENVNVDKAGTAAYKSVELDTLVGGFATQHREVQGKETPRFKSYFRGGFKVLIGSPPAKYNFTEDVFNSRLYRIKGVRAPIITQMAEIKWSELNSGDVFLLHTDTIIFIWAGRAANATEKSFAVHASKELQKEWHTSNTVFVDDGYEKTMLEDDRAIFEQYLPLNERVVRAANEAEDDATAEKKHRTHIKLYKCCEIKAKYRVTEIKTGPLDQEDLANGDVFILDHAQSGIWVWVGKSAKEKEHLDAIRNARGFVKKKKYKSNTPVTRVVDSAEPFEFKMLFTNWQDKYESKILLNSNKVPVIKVTKFDATTMYERPAFAAKSQLFDDGTGSLKIWRIKRSELVEIPKEYFGNFFNGDCYVLYYSYVACGEKLSIIYYWMGAHSVPDEQDTMIAKCHQLEEASNNQAIVGRICDGKESPHFLQLIKGRMRVFQGKGTEIDVSGMNTKTPKTYLLRVHGSSTYNTKAIQVPSRSSSLNSNYCFVLKKNNNNTMIWCGNYSTGDNREMAKLFASVDFNLILEGFEPEDFWVSLGGKKDFSMTSKVTENLLKMHLPARLFKSFTNTDQFKAEEILYFTQKDLSPESIMLLDAHAAIYIWIGDYCTKEDQKMSLEVAKEFLRNDTRGRDTKTTIIRIKQGLEPPTFTGFFETWNKKCWMDFKCYEEHRAEIERDDSHFIQRITNGGDTNDFDNYNKYAIPVLQSSIESLPQAVDPLKKELHLTYDDFVSLFKMEYSDFEKLPAWKRQEMKKNVGLF